MKSNLFKPQKSNPLSRFQLASKSITQNIQASKNNPPKYKPPQYCQHCSKLNQSFVTFKPTYHLPNPTLSPVSSLAKLFQTKVLNIKIDPTYTGISSILENQNLRLIELNRNLEIQREGVIQSVERLVGQIKKSVENYDSNKAIVGLDNVVKVVGGNKVVSYIQDNFQSQPQFNHSKVQYQVLEKSIQTIKSIISRTRSQYFPLTKKTLKQKYYFSLQDFDHDVNNIQSQREGNSNLLELFKIRIEDFIDEMVNEKKGKRMGLLEEEFERLRLFVGILKDKIQELEEERVERERERQYTEKEEVERYNVSVQKQDSFKGEDEDGLYSMLLNQCLVIQQFMSQQEQQQQQ